MGWGAEVIAVAFGTLVVGLPQVALGFFSQRRKVAVSALLLMLVPYPLALVTLQFAAFVCGFEIAE
jgi:hypothetical protein